MSFFISKTISAKLVGSNLVATFPTANPPLIWKFDLERNHSFTIALQGENGDWELGITSPKGEFYPIAHFPAKEDAEEALGKVQKVLMKKKHSGFWCWVRRILGFLLFVVLVLVFWDVLADKIPSLTISTLRSAAGPKVSTMPGITPGMPVSADDVLQPPR